MSSDPRKPSRPRQRNEDPPFYEALGRAIKVARTELGLERKELAERAGVSYAYLSDIESGRGRPSSSALIAIAQALGLNPSDLLRAAEARTSPQRVSPPAAASVPAESDWVMYERATPRSFASPNRPGSTASLREEAHRMIDELPDEALSSLLSLIRSITGR